MVLGILLAGLVAPFWLALGESTTTQFEVLVALVVIALVAVSGGVASAGVATLLQQRRQCKRFQRVLRLQLGYGRWVVVVNDIPWMRQSGVVSLMCERGLNWHALLAAQRSPCPAAPKATAGSQDWP